VNASMAAAAAPPPPQRCADCSVPGRESGCTHGTTNGPRKPVFKTLAAGRPRLRRPGLHGARSLAQEREAKEHHAIGTAATVCGAHCRAIDIVSSGAADGMRRVARVCHHDTANRDHRRGGRIGRVQNRRSRKTEPFVSRQRRLQSRCMPQPRHSCGRNCDQTQCGCRSKPAPI